MCLNRNRTMVVIVGQTVTQIAGNPGWRRRCDNYFTNLWQHIGDFASKKICADQKPKLGLVELGLIAASDISRNDKIR